DAEPGNYFWSEEDPARAQYEELARAGSLLQAGALRRWPQATIVATSARPEGLPADLAVDGVPAGKGGRALAFTSLAPGRHTVTIDGHDVALELPRAGVAVVALAPGASERPG